MAALFTAQLEPVLISPTMTAQPTKYDRMGRSLPVASAWT